jgi:hypothetical protein
VHSLKEFNELEHLDSADAPLGSSSFAVTVIANFVALAWRRHAGARGTALD